MMFKVNPALERDTITGLGPSDYGRQQINRINKYEVHRKVERNKCSMTGKE